jgi:O-acetyl-ADP-ribose deacetylase (regulator of RNase III)
MISFTQGNLLEANVEAVVNTVNTVGIMGKGIALMFKDKFPANFAAYARACERKDVRIGTMFVTENQQLFGQKWIINFPTKIHWRTRTKIEWIEEGLEDLVRVIADKNIRSIAVPPLGCGNGGLDWGDVRPLIVDALGDIADLEVIVYEPTSKYQNVSKRRGVEKLTPARALVSEIVRRYCLLGIECSILEVQKLAWFIERGIRRSEIEDPLNLEFSANKYGPYSDKLRHLLDSLDGSYLKCDKRLADAEPLDLIWFDEAKKDRVRAYLNAGEGKKYLGALEWTSQLIDGFESPLGMELLATIDWLFEKEDVERSVPGVLDGLRNWTGGAAASNRKLKIFDVRLILLALDQLEAANSRPN